MIKSRNTWVVLMMTLLQLVLHQKASAGVDGAGGELTYEYVNDSTYRFYFRYYRGCSGFPEWNELSLCYRNTTCGGIWYTKRLSKMVLTPYGQPNGQMVDRGCGGQTNTCTDPNSTNEMYREWWYSGEVTIPPCDKWLFSINIVERDRTGLTNLMISPYPDHNLYVEATINNTGAYRKQSSPFFTAPIPVYTCSGSPFVYNHGVRDPDGDVLVYKLIQPRSATADLFVVCAGYPPYIVPFAGPQYNITDNPLLTNNTFSLNSATGDISFTPTGTQVAYVAYLVEKYRNGVLIGSVMRDSRMEVRNCTAAPTQFAVNATSISGATLTGDTLFACSNTPVNFCFNATSTTAGTLLVAKDNSRQVMPGAQVTYSNQASANVSGCVQWTPQPLDTGFRYFVVSVKDSTCTSGNPPVIQSYRVPIYIRPGAAISLKSNVICPGASVVLTGTGGTQQNWSAAPANSTFSCTQCPVTTATPQDTTVYILTTNLANGCKSRDSVKVSIDRSNSVNATPDTLVFCDGGGYVELSASASGPKPLKNIVCGAYSASSTANLTNAELAQSSNNSNSSNVQYVWAGYWGPFYGYYGTQRMQIIYRKEELQQVGMMPGTIQKIAINFADFTGTNPTYSNVRIAMKCTDKFQFAAPFQSEFEVGFTETYTAASVTLHPGWNEFILATPYDYDTTKNLSVQFCYSGVSPQSSSSSTGMLPVYYVTTNYTSSIAAGQILPANACAGNIGTVTAYNRRPDTRFSFTPLPETNFSYNWTPTTGMSNPGAASTSVFVDTTTWFTVSSKGRNGCVVKDSVLVYIAKKDFSIYPKDPVVCEGEVVRFTGSGGYTYNWSNDDFTAPAGFSCLVCDTPDVTGALGDHAYKIIVADYFGCSDTLDATLRVNERPTTHIINNDTTVYYGQSVQLQAEGASHYVWSPGGSLNNDRIVNPVATPLSTTMYVATGYAPNGCPLKDSVLIKVNINEHPFIPNAFSPNGDGRNDVFKIGNLTHQRIMSFSIFNRWGKEVYKAGINQNGWDGMYNGSPAPIDTYFYYIELVLADGSIKRYRGDLTLIR